MDEIVIIIDTSVLRKHISLNTQEFELIAELSRINAIKIKLPEMVDKEFLSQKIAETESHYDKILTSLKQLHGKAQVSIIQFDIEFDRFQEAKNQSLIEIEKKWKTYKSEKSISVIPFSITATNKVFKDYFEGNPPFKNAKSRNDLPDAFILQSLLSYSNRKNLHFVCDDNALSESALQNNIKTHKNISDFLELPEIELKIKELQDLNSVNKEFDLIMHNEPILSEIVSDYLKDNIPIELSNSSGTLSKHKDKLVKIFEIKTINFDFNKARLYDSQFIVIPSSIEASIEIEMIYKRDDYLKLSSPNNFKKVIELYKQNENEEGVVVIEPYSGKLNLSLKFNISSPFKLNAEVVTFSDIKKGFSIKDMLNEYFK